MKVMANKTMLFASGLTIAEGEVLEVCETKLVFWDSAYRILKGKFIGYVVPKNNFTVLTEKTYTKNQVDSMEEYYLAKLNKERDQKERAQQLVKELTEQINKKNKEIEILDTCVNVLGLVLNAACKSIDNLRELDKAQKNG